MSQPQTHIAIAKNDWAVGLPMRRPSAGLDAVFPMPAALARRDLP